MFGIFGFILFIFLILFIIGLAIIGNIIKVILRIFGGRGKSYEQKRQTYTKDENAAYSEDDSDSSSQSRKKSKKRGKIFGSDEGEYIDFEEIK